MGVLAASSLAIVCVALAGVAFGPDAARAVRGRKRRRVRRPPGHHVADPGVELRTERRDERMLGDVLGADALEAYRALGFLHALGADRDGDDLYGYLIYPHEPIVSFDAGTGEILNEHVVRMPVRAGADGGVSTSRADDVLAKWMAIRADERGFINESNMHLPGRHLDPDRVRRDIVRLSEWTGRSSQLTMEQ